MGRSKKTLKEEDVEEAQKRYAQHLADRTGMPAESIEKEVEDLIRRSIKSLPEHYSPPYGSVVWFERFLEIAQTRKLGIVDREFVSLNIIGSKNESKVLHGLKFLGLIDEQNEGTEALHSLRVIGEAFQKRLSVIVQSAYRELFTQVVIQRARSEIIVNFFMQRYGYGERRANESLRIFTMLCDKAGIELPPELAERPERAKRRVITTKARERKRPKAPTKERIRERPPTGSIELKLGDIIIWLPKNDLNAPRKAKRLLDLYIEERQQNSG